jgi:hypothetical protein
MADGRKDILKSLGVKRRNRDQETDGEPSGGETSDDETSAAEKTDTAKKEKRGKKPTSSGSSGPKLGIKRRSGRAKAEADAAAAAEAERENEDSQGDEGDEAEEAEDSKADATPKRVGLGSDNTAVILGSLFKVRPDLRPQIPPRAFALKRTNGRYIGDGRAERKLKIGFKPGLVVYTIPPYLDGEVPVVEKNGTVIHPPLHRQPRFEEDGFVVDEAFNIVGDWYVYVVFEDDGQPLDPIRPEDKKKKRGRGRGSSGSGSGEKKSLGAQLGIKRRS